MSDDPKPRFEPEDFLPREYLENLSNEFERSIERQVDLEAAKRIAADLAPSMWKCMFQVAAVALENAAEELAAAQVTNDHSIEARIGAQAAVKACVDHLKKSAAAFRAKAESGPPQS